MSSCQAAVAADLMSRMSCFSAPGAVVSGILTLAVGISPAQEHGIDPTRLPGVVVDDTAAKKEGTWQSSRSVRPYVQAGYIHSAGGAGERVEFPLKSKTAGRTRFWRLTRREIIAARTRSMRFQRPMECRRSS